MYGNESFHIHRHTHEQYTFSCTADTKQQACRKNKIKKYKRSHTSVTWQVINFMMQNQNTRRRDEDGEGCGWGMPWCVTTSRNYVPICTRSIHGGAPWRNLCLCICKSFCCSDCCCSQSTKAIAPNSQISDVRAGAGNYFFHGATWETYNVVEGRVKRLNAILNNINCISLLKAVNGIGLTSW